jgi:hypothetical protein
MGLPGADRELAERRPEYLVDKWLDPQLIRSQGLFNEKMVQTYVTAFRNGKKFHDKRIWSLIFFQMWHHKYIAGNGD